MSYPLIAISEFCQTGSGTTPSRKEKGYYGGSIPWIKSGELRENEIIGSEECVTEKALQETSLKRVPAGSILVAMYGATVGRVGLLGIDATTNQAVCHIVPDSQRADTRYMFHALQHKASELVSRGVGGAQPNISQGVIKETQIPLPPLEEQKRIAAILDQADSLRRLRQRAIDRLNTLGQAIFYEMFGDPVANPKQWPTKKIADVAKVITGNTPSRQVPGYFGSDVEWIKSDNINTPYYYLTKAEEGLSEAGRRVARIAPSGSILVTCIAGSPECIGNSAMTDRDVAFNQQINALVPSDGDVHFIYAQLRAGKRLVQNASSASMKGMVSKSRFESIVLIWPPLPLQQKFSERIQALEQSGMSYRAAIVRLNALFTSLQHRAFRGEL